MCAVRADASPRQAVDNLLNMQIFHNPLHAAHAARQEMFRGRMVDSHEVPQRLEYVLDALRRHPLGALREPEVDDVALQHALQRVHTPAYLEFLQQAWTSWVELDPGNAERDALPSVWPLARADAFRSDAPTRHFAARLGMHAFDSGTALTRGTWVAARAGAACALAAARELLGGGRSAFALTRPPGHHAGPDYFGGYCFVNNAALAAQALRDGGCRRVAVLDIDYHHGNGTQTLFYRRSDVLTVSIHGDPQTEYPFFLGFADERGADSGLDCNLNLPLPRGSGIAAWREALLQGLQRVRSFGAEALVVPMGLDTFAGDPICGFALQRDDYPQIGSLLARAGLPTLFTFEGGYAVAELGIHAHKLLQGFVQAAA